MAAAGAGARISTGFGMAVLRLMLQWYMGGSPLLGKGSCKGPHGHRQEVGSRRMLLFSWFTFARVQDQALDLEEDEHAPLCSSPACSPIPFLPHMAAGMGGTRCQPPSQLLPLTGMARSWPQPCALGQQGAPPSTSLCWPARLPPLHGVTSRFSNQLVCTRSLAVQERSLPEAAFFSAFSERLLICLLRAVSHVPSTGGYGTSLA